MRSLSHWAVALPLIAVVMSAPLRVAAEEATELVLWPQGLPPGAKPLTEQRLSEIKSKPDDPERIQFVDVPSLTMFHAPQAIANGCGVIVCPGGGYNILAWPKEGVEVAKWLNTLGVTAGVLKYRVPRRDPDEPHREPLQDAQRAIRLMRANSEAWNIDPQRIGILGFSAGGHLSIATGLQGANATYAAEDLIDQRSCEPNFVCPIYAAYLGEKNNDRTEVSLGSQIQITPQTPPMFLAVSADDAYRGVQAASLFIALKQANIPAELHVYARGGHGYGIRPSEYPVSTWHHRLADWLGDSGFLRAGDRKVDDRR